MAERRTLTTQYTFLDNSTPLRVGGAGDGTRLAQTVNGVRTRYVVDARGQLPQVLEEQHGASVARYLYASGMVASDQDAVWMYQHGNAIGSIRQPTDASGLVWRHIRLRLQRGPTAYLLSARAN